MFPPTQQNVIAYDIPYSGRPASIFCSLSFKSKGDGLNNDDYFYLRDKLLGFLLPYDPDFIFPFGYANAKERELLVCFECSPRIKEPLEMYVYDKCRLHLQYEMKCSIEDFNPPPI